MFDILPYKLHGNISSCMFSVFLSGFYLRWYCVWSQDTCKTSMIFSCWFFSNLPLFSFCLILQIWSEVWELHQPCSLPLCKLCCRWGLKPAWWRVWCRLSTCWQASITSQCQSWLVMFCKQKRRRGRQGKTIKVTEICKNVLHLALIMISPYWYEWFISAYFYATFPSVFTKYYFN